VFTARTNGISGKPAAAEKRITKRIPRTSPADLNRQACAPPSASPCALMLTESHALSHRT
jgi:hypothetical protein